MQLPVACSTYKLIYVVRVLTAREKNSETGLWRHNERDGVSNHQPHDCLLNRLFSRRSSKFRVTALCERNSPVTGEFPTQSARKKDNVSFDDVNIDHVTNNLLQMLFRFGELCVPLF